jgi:hypothetical protein
MNFSLDMLALLLVLPEVALLSTFPFFFYRIASGYGRGSCAIWAACILSGLVVLAFYFLVALGSGMSGGGAGSIMGNRLLQSPMQVAISLVLFPVAAAWLALAGKGTLGLWVFSLFAGFLSYWAWRGWLLGEVDWWFTVAVIIAGGLCGLAAGLFLARRSPSPQHTRNVLLWSGVGVTFAAAGVLVSWLTHRPRPSLEGNSFSVDPVVMFNVLVVVAFVWLFLSTVAALGTGYITLNRQLQTDLPQ